jgi:acetyltransferase-like isoleucine patch superfamily enzyme
VGNFVFSQSYITHDCVVGPFSTISGGACLTGGTKVGERVFVGSNATIIPGRTIGDDAFISAGSVVIRNVKPGTKVFGNPARRVDI